MVERGSLTPVPEKPITVRSEDVIELCESIVFDANRSEWESARYFVGDFRKFLLYLDLDSTSSPTNLHVQVRFHHEHSNKAFDYKQGFFNALFWEDTDLADGKQECYPGDVSGREFSIKVTATGTDGSKKFTVSSAVEFYN